VILTPQLFGQCWDLGCSTEDPITNVGSDRHRDRRRCLQIRYDLHHQPDLTAPLAETSTHWIGTGLGDSLVACLRELIRFLDLALGLSEGEAYALCSLAVSFRVTQYAHQTGSAYTSVSPKAVHGMVSKDIFPAEHQQRIDAWLRPDRATAR
jgi:hypothetical protein